MRDWFLEWMGSYGIVRKWEVCQGMEWADNLGDFAGVSMELVCNESEREAINRWVNRIRETPNISTFTVVTQTLKVVKVGSGLPVHLRWINIKLRAHKEEEFKYVLYQLHDPRAKGSLVAALKVLAKGV